MLPMLRLLLPLLPLPKPLLLLEPSAATQTGRQPKACVAAAAAHSTQIDQQRPSTPHCLEQAEH